MGVLLWDSRSIRKALSQHASLEDVDCYGNTALHAVLSAYEAGQWWGTYDLIEELLNAGASAVAVKQVAIPGPNDFFREEKIPCNVGFRSTLMYRIPAKLTLQLIALGAEVNASGPLGKTALMYVVANSQFDGLQRCQLLLDHGAEINQTDVKGRNVLYYVTDKHLASFLVEAGADMHLQDLNGDTPLRFFVKHRKTIPNSKDLIRLVTSLGA